MLKETDTEVFASLGKKLGATFKSESYAKAKKIWDLYNNEEDKLEAQKIFYAAAETSLKPKVK